MILSLDYGSLTSASQKATKLANEINQYCDDLSRKVLNKINDVEGGSSSALNNASYYINSKLKQLRQKESNARTFSKNVDNLVSTAKRVDQDVARTIENRQKELFKKNPDLKPPGYKAKLTEFWCDLKKVPILGSLIKGAEEIVGAVETLKKNIKYWYKCEGGKELVGIVLSAVGAALAIVITVCAFSISGGVLGILAGVAGVISSLIGVVNAATNVATSMIAYDVAMDGHPGIAKIYAGQDKLSDYLKETKFNSKVLNRRSMICAAGIDIVDSMCALITFVTGGVKLIRELKKINIGQVFRSIGNNRSTLGTFVQGKPTIWNGIKSLVMKADIKSLILGDLNVKDFARFDLISLKDKYKAVGSFTKALKGIVDNFDKMNEGDMSFGEFIAHRIFVRVDTAILGQQELKTVDGERKYYDTKFTTIVDGVKQALSTVGLGKIINDHWGSKTIENIFDLKDGKYTEIINIIDNLKIIDRFIGGRIAQAVELFTPPIMSTPDPSSFVMPRFDFAADIRVSMPYLNIAL